MALVFALSGASVGGGGGWSGGGARGGGRSGGRGGGASTGAGAGSELVAFCDGEVFGGCAVGGVGGGVFMRDAEGEVVEVGGVVGFDFGGGCRLESFWVGRLGGRFDRQGRRCSVGRC